MAAKPKEKTDNQELLEVAKKRFQLAVEAESEQRKDALDDLEFRAGHQWDDKIKSDRQVEGKPCLTINKIVQSVHQVTNDQRQNRPSIKVNPVDNDASVETAEIFEGLIRHIEYCSNADVAYDRAFEGAATTGLGYFRIITGYCDDKSFDQEIKIKSIRNRFSVYVDPHYQEPDGSDMNWGFIFEDMSKEDFKAQYPDSKLSKMEDWVSIGDKSPGWTTRDTARIAEYFYKTFEPATIQQLSDGSVITKGDPMPEGATVTAERETKLPAIKWCKMNGIEVLEETDWLGSLIPIIPVLGDELDVDGKKILEGIVRHAKGPQQMYNYFASTETETIALAPKAPWIGAEGQFKGFEKQWQNSNRKNYPFLEYVPKSLNGTPLGPPQRTFGEPNVQAITQARAQAADDLKSTTGLYDPSLGQQKSDQSGVAIQRLNNQAQTSNFHLNDNLTRSLRHAGRVIIELIPKIYDTARIARIVKEDGSSEMVPVNQPYTQNGKDMNHDLSKGRYDVTVSTGPSYQTKRQEAASTMMAFVKALPNTAPIVSDLIARNMDWPGSDQIADRLKKGLPPGIADDKDQQQPIPPQVKQQMDQMNGVIQQLTQHLHAAQDEIDHKSRELASRERIANAQVQANLEIALAKLNTQSATTLLEHQVAEISQRQQMIGQNAPLNTDSNSQAAAPAQVQPPTGGQSPGQSMGSNQP